MLIGELGTATGLSTHTLRFYERRRLLPPAARATNGYRSYDDTSVARVGFIRAAQGAGLTLAEIRSVLDIRDDGQAPCRHVADLVDDKLTEVRRRMSELAALERELEQLRDRSRRLDPADCTDPNICHIITGPPTTLPATDRS